MKSLITIIKSILFTAILLNGFSVLGQLRQNVSILKESGVIIFEGELNVFEMYFIKTSQNKLTSVFKNNDTVNAIILGAPGDNASDIDGFMHSLNESIKFDTLSLIISQKNHLGEDYEKLENLFSKFGYVNYTKSKSYKLVKRYKKVYFNNKSIIIALEDFVPVNSFSVKSDNEKVKM